MKKYDKLLFAAALIVLITIIAVSLRDKSSFSETEISFYQWWGELDTNQDDLTSLIKTFEEENPGIKINLVTLPRDAIKKSINELPIQSEQKTKDNKKNIIPDLAAFDPLWFNDLNNSELWTDLSAYGINGSSLQLASFPNALYYNVDILADEGFDRPPKTRSEFIEFCRRLKGKNMIPFYAGYNIYSSFFPWILMSGIDPEKEFDFQSQTIVETFDLFKTLHNENLVNSNFPQNAEDKKLEFFNSGRAAMMISSSNDIKNIRNKSGISFSVTTVPAADNYYGKPFFNAENWNVGIPAASNHKDAAAAFLSFLAANINFEDAASNDDVNLVKLRDICESGEFIYEYEFFPNSLELEKILREELEAMFKTQRSAKETAAAVQNRYPRP
ncbi:sugar ABC transporter substrate-binding protein [Spirochaetia bacterium]|nr:sugar ABC transporter substrate-binding protein [Spirochaetia bacterium]